MKRDLLNDIRSITPNLSKGQKSIALYISEHYDKAAFMTASKLGAITSVSESTVVRFAVELGFDGYPQLQKELQELIRNKLTSMQRIDVSAEFIGEHDVLEKILNSDIEKIKKTLADISKPDFEGAVDAIANASTIYILGVRSASALAEFMNYYFSLILKNVKLVYSTGVSEMFEQILRITPEDVFIGLSFPRYSSRTVKVLKFASDRGAKVIAITDSMFSPLIPHSQFALLAKSDMASFVDSLVAPLSLINALIVAVGLKKRVEVYQTFSELESIWDEYDVYQKVDDKKND
jgi:DNA-binding MurR/RpiR family transcriptional regulator